MARTVIVGAARSGLAAASHLARSGVDVLVTDARPEPTPEMLATLRELGVPGVWGGHPDVLLDDCAELLLSPGVPPSLPFVRAAEARGVPVIGELELAHRLLRERGDGSKVLAITGTNGKSTTTDLLAHLLRASGVATCACGNLGKPLVEALAEGGPGTVYAVECSSYQLETVRTFRAEGAALLNLTPDHLARHGSLEAYLAAKLRIFERQTPQDVRLLPAVSPEFATQAPGSGRSAAFGWGPPQAPGAWCDPEGHLWLVDAQGHGEPLVHREDLKVPGRHNVENALVAAFLAYHGGASLGAIRQGLQDYPGLAHRIAFCGERNGIRVYNDSKGTNVDATVTAIQALPGPLVLLLGGEDKGTSYRPLAAALEGKLRKLIFLGDAIAPLERDLGDLPHTSHWAFDTATQAALAAARPGDQVLLSPACASFDQFRNFEHRGEHFETLVRAWIASA